MTFDPIQRLNLTFSAGAVAVSLALATPAFAAGVAIGAALETVNFRAMRRSAELLFQGELAGARGWSAGYAARFLLLVVGMVVAIFIGAHPIGLVVGLSLIMPAAVIEAWRTRPPIVEDLPALPPDDPSWDRWNPWLAREREDEEDDA